MTTPRGRTTQSFSEISGSNPQCPSRTFMCASHQQDAALTFVGTDDHRVRADQRYPQRSTGQTSTGDRPMLLTQPRCLPTSLEQLSTAEAASLPHTTRKIVSRMSASTLPSGSCSVCMFFFRSHPPWRGCPARACWRLAERGTWQRLPRGVPVTKRGRVVHGNLRREAESLQSQGVSTGHGTHTYAGSRAESGVAAQRCKPGRQSH